MRNTKQFRGALERILQGDTHVVDDKELKSLIEFMEEMREFYLRYDDVMVFWLTNRINQCFDLQRRRMSE